MAVQCTLTTEELLPWFGLSAESKIYEGSPPGGNATSIIRTDQPWYVRFEWATTGALNYIMAGSWHLEAHLEEMGKGEFTLPNAEVDVAFVSQPNVYTKWIVIPSGTVPPGVYRLIVTITMVGPGGVPGPMAGFGDCGLLQFYSGGPLP